MCVPQINGRRLSGEEVSAMCLCSDKNLAYTKDLLALSTVYTKDAFAVVEQLIEKYKRSRFYIILCKTTQPAHLLTFLVTTILCFALFPRKATSSQDILDGPYSRPSLLTTFVYLISVSLHFGAQIWMTFVSGLSLYFALPRHVFGSVQRVLFPRYFTINAALSFVTLLSFLKHSHLETWQSTSLVQVILLTLCFVIEFVTRTYMIPPMVVLLAEKCKREIEQGVGQEVGDFQPGKLTECPVYMAIHNSFRKSHMSIAMINMLAMICTLVHIYYLAGKICIV